MWQFPSRDQYITASPVTTCSQNDLFWRSRNASRISFLSKLFVYHSKAKNTLMTLTWFKTQIWTFRYFRLTKTFILVRDVKGYHEKCFHIFRYLRHTSNLIVHSELRPVLDRRKSMIALKQLTQKVKTDRSLIPGSWISGAISKRQEEKSLVWWRSYQLRGSV